MIGFSVEYNKWNTPRLILVKSFSEMQQIGDIGLCHTSLVNWRHKPQQQKIMSYKEAVAIIKDWANNTTQYKPD